MLNGDRQRAHRRTQRRRKLLVHGGPGELTVDHPDGSLDQSPVSPRPIQSAREKHCRVCRPMSTRPHRPMPRPSKGCDDQNGSQTSGNPPLAASRGSLRDAAGRATSAEMPRWSANGVVPPASRDRRSISWRSLSHPRHCSASSSRQNFSEPMIVSAVNLGKATPFRNISRAAHPAGRPPTGKRANRQRDENDDDGPSTSRSSTFEAALDALPIESH